MGADVTCTINRRVSSSDRLQRATHNTAQHKHHSTAQLDSSAHLEDGASKRDALLLAARQPQAALADHRVVLLRV